MNFKAGNLLLALLSAFLGSVKGLLVSHMKNLGAIEIFGLRSLGTVFYMLPIIIYGNFKLWHDSKHNVILLKRSIVGNVAVIGYYFGFVNLPMAEASLLFYSTPLFTVILGHIFLKEKCGIKPTFSVVLSLTGVFLVCLPYFSFQSAKYSGDILVGIVGCVIGAIAQAIALVIVRTITHIPPIVVSFWWATVGVLFSGCFCLVVPPKIWSCGLESTFVILIAFIGFVCELCLVASLKSTDAIIVSIALTVEIMFAFLFQIYINKETAGPFTALGGVAIILSVLLPPLVSFSCSKKGDFKLETMQYENHLEEAYSAGEIKELN